jgi:hypothetical protein
MPPQIQRLVLLTLAIVASYFVARGVLTPRSFGQYGWYRGDALQEIAKAPMAYAGKPACVICHPEVPQKMGESKHRNVSCESCHGANAEHAEDPSVSPGKITNAQFCLRCHQANAARPASFPQIDLADHFGDGKCAECHLPHTPKEAPAK